MLAALLSGRGQISTDRRVRKYSNASYSSMGGVKSFSLRDGVPYPYIPTRVSACTSRIKPLPGPPSRKQLSH